MLFHSIAAPHSGINVEQAEIVLSEDVRPAALRDAGDWIVARHEMLRAGFRGGTDGRPSMFIGPAARVAWTEEDLRAYSVDARAARMAQWREADRRAGFSLEAPPLLRFALHRCGDTRWIFTWTFHHALLDGRAYATVLTELFAAYAAFRDGREPALPPPIPLDSYYAWLNAPPRLAEAEQFWRKELRGFHAPTPLPFEAARCPGASGAPAQQDAEIELDEPATAALQRLARELGVSEGNLVQAAWALLLARHSGESEVVFGAIRSGRKSTVPRAGEMVAIFINAVPLRVRCAPEMSVAEFVWQLRARWMALRDHEHTPLVLAQRVSEVPKGQPLFDTLVVYERQTLEAQLRARGAEWHPREVRLFEQTNFALTLAAYGGPRLLLRIQFDSRRYVLPTVTRLLGHLRTLLEALPAEATRRIGELPILTAGERQALVVARNAPRVEHPVGQTLIGMFEAQVARTPEAVVVTCGSESLTYRTLNRRANALARQLRRLGVGPEKRVGLFVERSPDLIVGLLAILKAGGAYVPLDSAYPAARLDFMIEDAGLIALVTQSSACARFAATLPCVPVDDVASVASTIEHDLNPPLAATPETLAYVIYTSGSTGKPKGVLVTQANVMRLFQATDGWFRFGPGDVWTLFHSVAFDFSVWEIWGALLHGGRLVVVPYLVSRSPEQFLALLESERVTVLNQTPSAFQQLVEVDGARAAVNPARLALRYVVFGGEALNLANLRPWFDRHGDTTPRLINMYGITETTVHVTYRPITRADLEGGSVIGKRIPDLQLYILDPRQQPVPVGVAGELYVGGAGVTRGYLNRPELTAQRFVTLPQLGESAGRLYRTGDRARWLPDGDIEYLGRLDFQVKIRGHRVELGEIESALAQHPQVAAAVVQAMGEPGGVRLVSYVVRRSTGLGATELRQHLATRLPHYMVPSAVVWLGQLPLTENGKVDRRALPVPDLQRPEVSASFVAPRTTTEKRLVEIWREVLQLDRVGVQDNFFELGGNSLLLVQLLTRARREFSAPLEIADLFARPTVQALAERLDRATGGPKPPEPALHQALLRAQRQAAALRPLARAGN